MSSRGGNTERTRASQPYGTRVSANGKPLGRPPSARTIQANNPTRRGGTRTVATTRASAPVVPRAPALKRGTPWQRQGAAQQIRDARGRVQAAVRANRAAQRAWLAAQQHYQALATRQAGLFVRNRPTDAQVQTARVAVDAARQQMNVTASEQKLANSQLDALQAQVVGRFGRSGFESLYQPPTRHGG